MVRATVRKMSSSEADEVACSVVRLFAAIVRESATGEAYAALGLDGNGAHNAAALNGSALNGPALNGFNGLAAAARVKNGAPQVIAL